MVVFQKSLEKCLTFRTTQLQSLQQTAWPENTQLKGNDHRAAGPQFNGFWYLTKQESLLFVCAKARYWNKTSQTVDQQYSSIGTSPSQIMFSGVSSDWALRPKHWAIKHV